MLEAASALAVLAIVLALGFDFVNGFHDTANAVATVIYTKALPPRVAIVMSGILNFLGALIVGTAVAQVIAKIIAVPATIPLVLAVLLGAISWNIITWWRGLPVSSSHCLIGALFGAGIAAAGLSGVNWHELTTVGLALLISPVAGFAAAAVIAPLAARISGERDGKPGSARVMRVCQIFSSAAVSFSHGSNDGQKTMGIITLILATQFAAFGYTAHVVPLWVMAAAAAAMGVGTMIGGWRIIRTVGERISTKPITPLQGFAAECGTTVVSLVATHFGAPISTTHTLNPAVAGSTLGTTGIRHLNFKMVRNIVVAWLLTLPAAALFSGAIYLIFRLLGLA